MSGVRFIVLLAGCLLSTGGSMGGVSGSQAHAADHDMTLVSGEELVYEVRWSFFSIGTIRLKTSSPIPMYGAFRHRVDAFIDSYDGLPFVDFHAIISSFLDSTLISRGARAYRRIDDRWRAWEYEIDTTAGVFYVDGLTVSGPLAEPSQRRRLDTVRVKNIRQLQDGLSILSYARSHARRPREVTVPVISTGKLGSAWFSFGMPPTSVEIDAHPKPIRTIPFEGQLTAKGLFGLTGDFKGWVSDDGAAVPIKAELQVLLGKIKVELKEWKRVGWTPPS